MDKYEKDILEDIENDEFQRVENFEEELGFLKRASSNYAKKSKKISIRLTENDLEKIKSKGIELSIPYQTLISSLIHQFVNDKIEVRL
jgi:predicted DNA binding CopG/RHH family protein